jgi:hypothetical protein
MEMSADDFRMVTHQADQQLQTLHRHLPAKHHLLYLPATRLKAVTSSNFH